MGSIVRQIQRWDSVGELLGFLQELLPLFDGHTITRDAAVNHGKIERARYIGIGIDQSNSLTEGSKPFCNGIVSRLSRWSNAMSRTLVLRSQYFRRWVVF